MSQSNLQSDSPSNMSASKALVQLVSNCQQLCERTHAESCRMEVEIQSGGRGTVLDFGSNRLGTIAAGIRMAEICLGGLGSVTLTPGDNPQFPWPRVMVTTDHPLHACIASQYAGWAYTSDSYFAMCSGPARLNRGHSEPILAQYELSGHYQPVVGVFESSRIPSADVINHFAGQCGVSSSEVTLCIARTASLPGTLQVVARSIETAMHKLHELEFDLRQVKRGVGWAPLPPIGRNDLISMGWTNDAILYGGHVMLWVDADDESLKDIVPLIPSQASSDFGKPFGDIFDRYDRDFYQIDKLLFSPASILVNNLNSGKCYQAGKLRPDILATSFARE